MSEPTNKIEMTEKIGMNEHEEEVNETETDTTQPNNSTSMLGQIKSECIPDTQAWKDFFSEIKSECSPPKDARINPIELVSWWQNPYFPAFHSPGWLLKYVVGPHTPELGQSFFEDIAAGITVSMTLVPQVVISVMHSFDFI